MSGAHTGTVWVDRRGQDTRRCLRAFLDPPMRAFLDDPERSFAAAPRRKDGNSATVASVAIGARAFIVKRYNVTGLLHRLRVSLRHRTRGRNAWRFGQLLHDAGVPTARPIALIERRRGWLRDTCYLVMEDLGDRDLRTVLSADVDVVPPAHLVRSVCELFVALVRLRVCHGDTKATNFLVVGERAALIDLDSMRPDVNGRGITRDLQRFLANWRDQPRIHETFVTAFRAAGLPGL
ncbi:MAG: hypothetical protein KF911_11505 [Pseudomonadales bacterium]|nr:hypothetical protein [Pseudomonadales bacterium]